MMERDDDLLLILFALLASDADDEFASELVNRAIRRWSQRKERHWSPELEELVMMWPRGRSRSRQRRMEEAREVAQSVVDGFRSGFAESIRGTLNGLDERLAELKANADRAREFARATDARLTERASELHTFFWAVSSGVDVAETELVRFIPSRMFVDDPLPHHDSLLRLARALHRFAETLDLAPAEELPEESGSWWKKLFFRTKEVATHPEVLAALEAGKRALQGACDKPQAEVNKNQAEAAAALIQSLDATACACVQLGSLLLIKTKDSNSNTALICRTLSPEELKRLEERQTVLSDPSRILEWLESGGALPGKRARKRKSTR